jgi:hypothetical protein
MSTPTPPPAKKHITFDPTINAGHVLTFIAMALAVLTSWNLLDKRITVVEQAQQFQRERDIAQDGAVVQKFGEVKEALTEVKQAVNELRRDGREQKGRP